MTTLLTSKQADTLRSIGDSAMVLFALWMIDRNFSGRMTTAEELKPYLYPHIKDKRKIEAQLNALCASGRLTQTSAGYVLLEGGRALMLGMAGNKDLEISIERPANLGITAGTDLQHQAQPNENIIDAKSENLPESDARAFRASLLKKKEEEDLFLQKNSSSSEIKSAENARKIALRPGTEEAWAFQNLKVGESAIVPKVTGYTFEDGTPVYQMDRGDGTLITTREILKATEVIEGFGDIGAKLPVDAIKPELALAWVAKAYDDRANLHRPPAGAMICGLRDGKDLHRRYFKNPTQYLPDEYCAELGLIKYDCKSCVNAKFSTRAALEEHVQKMHVLPESKAEWSDLPEVDLPVMDVLESDHPGSKAWREVVAQLQMEMPRASFDTWVRDTQPVNYDGRLLTVAARNAYCRDWLESRLESTVNRLLVEILSQPVTVRFVVGEVGDA